MTILGRAPATRTILGRSVSAITLNGRSLSIGGPAGGNYIHSLWGDTTKLTAPRALSANHYRITDIRNGLVDYSNTGPAGQTVEGITKTTSGFPSSYDGESAPAWEQLSSGGQFFQVEIDGNGDDVWVDLSGSATNHNDLSIVVDNCRTFRLTGFQCIWDADSPLAVAGRTPDNSWNGSPTAVIYLRNNTAVDAMAFFEGCYVDFKHGGAPNYGVSTPGTDYYPHYRTDAFGIADFSQATNNAGVVVWQNCVIENNSDKLWSPPTHSDMIQWYGQSYEQYCMFENCEFMGSHYQGLHHSSNYTPDEHEVLTNKPHWRFYNVVMNKDLTSGEDVAYFLWLRHGSTEHMQGLEVDGLVTVISTGNGWMRPNGYGQDSAPTNDWHILSQSDATSQGYLDARSDLPLYQDYGDARGQTQPEMLWMGPGGWTHYTVSTGGGVEQTAHSETYVPRSAIGNGYASLWDAAGNLLAE